MVGQEVNKRAHPRWERTPLTEIDGMDVLAVPRIEFLQHRNQMARLDICTNVEQGEPRKPRSPDSKPARDLTIAGAPNRRG